jgi:myosin I
MDIIFNFKSDPIGGHIQNYLLEKSRVVYQQNGERNFHSFYYLLFGNDEHTLKSKYFLTTSSQDYIYISQGNTSKVQTIDDRQNFLAVNDALKVVGFKQEVIQTIWNIIGAIIHLGNVNFDETGSHDNCTITEKSLKDEIKAISNLLSIDQNELTKALTSRLIATGSKDLVTAHHMTKDASYGRDAFAKAIYERLFSWIVSKINDSLDVKRVNESKSTLIGVLDIYGFEIFDNNSFEQLCINYCNEKLQQLFIELVLKQEQEEYKNENINWTHIDYFNNKIICDLVEQSRKGIFAIVDEASYTVGNINDEILLEHLDKQLKDHAHYSSRGVNLSDKSLAIRSEFRIVHYAGDVKYSIKGFIDKNKDTLFQDLKRLLYNSRNLTIKEMWPEGAQHVSEITKRPPTAAYLFKNSMIELVQNLSSKNPFYVRCIKPNEIKSANTFDYKRVETQVSYLGLLENVRVRRAGFAYRVTYEKFLSRYKCISNKTWPNPRGDSSKDNVSVILRQHNFENDAHYGLTKVFIKSSKTLFALEQKRADKIPELVIFLQKIWKGTLARRKYKKLRAANRIFRLYRFFHARKYIYSLCTTFE